MLSKHSGTVEREEGAATAPWKPVQPGAQYYLNDAARVLNGSAMLDIAGGAAHLLMLDGTTLRFGGEPGKVRIAVETGAVDVSTDSYALDVGDVRLSNNSKVRITARGNGQTSVELTLGRGQISSSGFELELGKSVDVGTQARVPIDAGVRDAAVARDAAVDAADDAGVDTVGQATIEVTGRRAELLAPGQTAWKPLPAGQAALARGSAVRLGAGTTARLSDGDTTVELSSGGRVKLADSAELGFTLEAGGARVVATGPAAVGLPGGAIALAGAGSATAETRLDAGARDTRVTMLRGGSRLTGDPGTELTMTRGETAVLTRSGTIRVIEAIPTHFDLRVPAGESFAIHDPRPGAAVQFQFDGKCPEGGIIEIDRDARFRTARVSAGRDFANALLGTGIWAYRLRCTRDGGEGFAVAQGRISVLRDDGRRPLPRLQGTNEIEADGRIWRISYQSAIPNLVLRVRNPGASHRLHLASAGREQTFDSTTPVIHVPAAQLREGSYTYWLDRDGVKQDKVSTLIIDFDQTAPQVYIESPDNAQAWTGDLDVRGAVLPGWTAAVEDVAIPIDRQRRFAARVGVPAGKALAIRLSHPQRGVHYYLRRPK